MQAINVGFIGLLAVLSSIDLKTLKVPVWGLVALAFIVLVKGFIFYDLFYGALIMAFSVYFSDFVLKRETVGGGDFWVGILMSCYMGLDRFLIAYTVAALMGQIAYMTVNRRANDVAYLPYLAYGAFWAIFVAKI